MQKTGSGFGTSRRLPEGALADLEPSPIAFIETPAARLSKLRLTASVTLEKRRGGGFAIVRSRPFRPRGKSAQAQSATWKTRLRSILETYGKPSDSPPARRALRITNKMPAIFHTPNTKYNPRHVPVIQNNTCLSRYLYILILPIYLSSFVKETLSGH
jgi:hypothetical protein